MSDPTPVPDDPGSITANKVITDPKRRRRLGILLYLLLFAIGTVALFFAFFPEATLGSDIPVRAIAFGTTVVNYAAAAFGLAVTTPNVPKT